MKQRRIKKKEEKMKIDDAMKKKITSEEECKRNNKDGKKDDDDDDGDNQPLSKIVRLAGYRRSSSTTLAAISTPISKTPSERSDRGKKVNQSESIEDQSLRLRLDVVKELDSGVDIDLKGIGFVEPANEKASTKYKSTMSLPMSTTKEVPSKESTKDSGPKTETYQSVYLQR